VSPNDEPPTEPVVVAGDGSLAEPTTSSPTVAVRLFGSRDFFRLWIAQVVSALGDWIGFVAIVAIATRVGHSASGAASVSLVMSARLVPGFFLAPIAGVLVDRWNRKWVLVTCDLARAGVLATLPWVRTIWGLVIASLLLEVATLLWSPAKEASVPELVPADHLTTANSLSLAAAYGTFPVASLLYALLAKVSERLAGIESLGWFRPTQDSLAIYVDVITFATSALLISSLVLGRAPKRAEAAELRMNTSTFDDLREGWRFMFTNPVVRAVMVALATGLVGGGMVVPLGDVFSRRVLGGGSAGFGLLLSALGFGVAGGVLLLSAVQRRVPKADVFCTAVIGAGASLLVAASMSTLTPAFIAVGIMGMCAGAVYVLGFTILHESVIDELRGRIFASLYTLVRFGLLLSFAVGPVLADRLGALSNRWWGGKVHLGGFDVALPGVRLALWLAGVIILGAGALAVLSLRLGGRETAEQAAG
jgi:dTMP kinase